MADLTVRGRRGPRRQHAHSAERPTEVGDSMSLPVMSDPSDPLLDLIKLLIAIDKCSKPDVISGAVVEPASEMRYDDGANPPRS